MGHPTSLENWEPRQGLASSNLAASARRKGMTLMDYVKQVLVSDQNRMGGVPCIKGTRFTFSQLLAELADGSSLTEICDDFDLDYKACTDALNAVATAFNRPGWPNFEEAGK